MTAGDKHDGHLVEVRDTHDLAVHDSHDVAVHEVLDGPFTTRQLLRLDDALSKADRATGFTFSVYVGDISEPIREGAEKLHARLAHPANSVLLAVAPEQRQLEIVTGSQARKRLSDRDCKLAALSMAAAFGGGDLAGGIVSGLAQLTGLAGKPS